MNQHYFQQSFSCDPTLYKRLFTLLETVFSSFGFDISNLVGVAES